MKKTVFLFAAIILVALVFMPYINGRLAQQVTLQMADQVNSNSLKFGQVGISKYERGLLHSDIQFTWLPSLDAKKYVSQALEFECAGKHGVFGYNYDCKVKDVDAYTTFINRYLEGHDPLTIRGDVSIFGTVTQSLHLSSFEMRDSIEGKLEQINFKPAQFSVSTDRNLESFVIDGRFDGVSTQTETSQFKVDEFRVAGKLRTNQHQLAIGDIRLEFDSLSLLSDQNSEVRLMGLSMSSETKEDGENIVLNSALAIDNFERSFGSRAPGQSQNSLPNEAHSVERLDLSDFESELIIGGANMVEVGKLTKSFQSISQLPSEQRNAAMISIFPELEALFKTGLNLVVNAHADYKKETVSLKADTALVADLRFADFILLSVNPKGFFSKFKASLRANLPQALFDSNPSLAMAIKGNPLYSKTDIGFTSEIKLNDSQVELNGQAMDIEELLAILSQAAPK